MTEKEEADKKMVEMVKAVNENPAYKVLTREEYDLLIAAKDEKGPGKPKLADLVNKISTPAPRPGTPAVKPSPQISDSMFLSSTKTESGHFTQYHKYGFRSLYPQITCV